jgi:peptidoglycan hydrolase-like protein with peptidoglycan-binding domain
VQTAVGASADGDFGPATATAVRRWQTSHSITVSGVVYYATWRSLLAATR